MEISPCPYRDGLHINIDRASTLINVRPNPLVFPVWWPDCKAWEERP
jgi:hypothetical protein